MPRTELGRRPSVNDAQLALLSIADMIGQGALCELAMCDALAYREHAQKLLQEISGERHIGAYLLTTIAEIARAAYQAGFCDGVSSSET